MSSFKGRLKVLEAMQDGKCAECWQQLIEKATDYHLALEQHGISEATARRHIFFADDFTDDERAQIAAVLPNVQDEVIALNEIQQRWNDMRPGCEKWFTRHTGGTPNEY